MNALLPALLSASMGISSFCTSATTSSGMMTPAMESQPDTSGSSTLRVVDERPIIRVTGSGEVQRRPDYAVVYVGIDVREQSAMKASEEAGAKIATIVKALEGLKIQGTQVQTTEVRLSPAYKWDGGDQQRLLVGYDASSMVKVRIDDPKAAGKVIDAATGAGANRIDGISFEINQALEARQEALRLAARAAKQKAETLADALEMRITCVIEATTSSNEGNVWMPQAQLANSASRVQEAGGFDGSVEPGLVTVRAEASVTFGAKPR